MNSCDMSRACTYGRTVICSRLSYFFTIFSNPFPFQRQNVVSFTISSLIASASPATSSAVTSGSTARRDSTDTRSCAQQRTAVGERMSEQRKRARHNTHTHTHTHTHAPAARACK